MKLLALSPAEEKIGSPELERVIADAGAAEATAAALEQPAPAPPLIDWLAQARELVTMAAGMLLPFYPELEPVWTVEKQTAVSNALAPVLAKYGVQLPDIFARYAPELGLLIVMVPLARETRRALREAAKVRAGEESPKSPPGAPPGVEGQVPIIDRSDPNSLHHKA